MQMIARALTAIESHVGPSQKALIQTDFMAGSMTVISGTSKWEIGHLGRLSKLWRWNEACIRMAFPTVNFKALEASSCEQD